jgi:hypothetical protein
MVVCRVFGVALEMLSQDPNSPASFLDEKTDVPPKLVINVNRQLTG